MNIRPLNESDVEAWKRIRRRMLEQCPEAFGADAEDLANMDDGEIRDRIVDGNVIGAWIGGRLVGCVGWYHDRGRKRRHLCQIWGMYVEPHARRHGIGRALVEAALRASGNAGVELWHLGVEESNAGARALYEALGFEPWGIERDALRLPGKSVNIVHMRRADEALS